MKPGKNFPGLRSPVPAGEQPGHNALPKPAAVTAALVIVFMILSVLYYSPLPVLEKAEEAVRASSFPDKADDSLVSDPGEMARQHRQLIVRTQEMYREVRDEIVEVIRSGPITETAEARCRELAASGQYGPRAQFGSFRWYIPESEEELDLTLSAAEADKLIYLYSQLYDMDFLNGSGTTFEGWFYGVEGTSALYPVEAFGNTYYYEGRGGYCMPLDKLKEVREIAERMAERAAREAAAREWAENAGSPLLVPIFTLFKALIPSAEAASRYPEAASAAYASAMEAGYRTYGTAAAQLIIYTGIHDTLTGEITFTLSSEPADIWPQGTVYRNTLEKFLRDEEALAIVADFNSMPFQGKLAVEIRDQVTTGSVTSPETFRYVTGWREEPAETRLSSSGKQNSARSPDSARSGAAGISPDTGSGSETIRVPVWSAELPCWTETLETHTKIIEIRAYEVQEWVHFTGTATVNGSGLTEARRNLLEGGIRAIRSGASVPEGMTAEEYIRSLFPEDLAYPGMRQDVIDLANSTIGDTDGYHYMSNAYLGWCAGWVYTVYDRLGLTGELSDLMQGITKDVWTTYSVLTHAPDDPVLRSDGSIIAQGKGYDHSPNTRISQFGYTGPDAYTAREGDVIFWRRDGAIAHIGIVTAVSADSVTVTQGNSGDRVEMIRYTDADDGLGLLDGEIVHIPYDDYMKMEVIG